MSSKRLKYCLLGAFFVPVAIIAQPQGNASVVTIVGEAPLNNEEAHDFINSNPYTENNEPQIQQQISTQNIEPTLENGFHMRFELSQASQESNFQKTDAPVMASGFTSSSGSSGGGTASVGKTKKHAPSIEERSFNTKKKIKRWLPKRKKRYRPHLCGRF